MKIFLITYRILFLLIILLIVSCTGKKANVFTPVPDFSVFDISNRIIDVNRIADKNNMPRWLSVYISDGIAAVERLDIYNDKYVFIAMNQGANFAALTKWAENISPVYDFPMIAAARIEKRIISSAALYPDDEYGLFFETMIKNVYRGTYTGVVKEDAHWISIRADNENTGENGIIFMYFVLMTIERSSMQTNVRNMIGKSSAAVTVTNAQNSAINRLRQTFFTGF